MTESREWIVINDRRVDRRLLEARPTQRCRTEECQSWCCTGGVWLDLGERDKILANAELIKPHLPPDRHDESTWFEGEDEHPDYPTGRAVGTSVVTDPTHRAGYTCVFLRPEDRYCALQVTSLVNGQHPWSLKPFYCALHPITTEYDQVMLDDDNEIYIEGGNCQRAAETAVPLYEVFEGELRLVLGEEGYERLKHVAAGKS